MEDSDVWYSYFGGTVVCISCLCFHLVNRLVGFGGIPEVVRQNGRNIWRWKNISVSFVHSVISAIGAVLCFYWKPEMTEDLIKPYSLFSMGLISMSVGYFLHDMLDMIFSSRNRQGYELIFHHAIILVCFGIAITGRQFVGYAVVALLVELNSIFLHSRQLMQMLGFSREDSVYRLNSLANIGTFIPFRIMTLSWMTRWLVVNRDKIFFFAYTSGSMGLAVMVVMNICLLYRLMRSDFGTQKTKLDH